jgi:hypothetical protein
MENPSGPTAQPSFFPSAALTGSLILLLFLVSQPIVYSQAGVTLREVMHDLSTDRLNEQDSTLLNRGYYEDLTRVNRFNSQLWELYNKQPNNRVLAKDEKAQPKKDMPVELPPAESALEEMKVTRPTNDFLAIELQPSMAALFHGAPFHTNRWGMRDKDYELKPPPGTCRIALIGASPELGSGVSDDQVWETILEDRLNRENDRKKVAQYEILNFSGGGYGTLERLRALETRAFSFDPDIVFYVAHPADQKTSPRRLAQFVTKGTENPYDYLRQVIHQAGIEGETNVTAAERALRPYNNDIISWIYRRIVELCRQRSIVPVFIILPTPGAPSDQFNQAKEAGFVMVDLSDLYDNVDAASMRISDWDLHPDASAHKLIADRLYKELKSNPALLQKLK